MTVAKAGTLVSVETGCYSDYHVVGFFVVLKDFDPKAKVEAHVAANPEEAAEYHFDSDKYLASLLAEGLLLEIPYGRIHTDNYSNVSEFEFTPMNNG